MGIGTAVQPQASAYFGSSSEEVGTGSSPAALKAGTGTICDSVGRTGSGTRALATGFRSGESGA